MKNLLRLLFAQEFVHQRYLLYVLLLILILNKLRLSVHFFIEAGEKFLS